MEENKQSLQYVRNYMTASFFRVLKGKREQEDFLINNEIGGAAMDELEYLIYELYLLSMSTKDKILKNCYQEISRLGVPKKYWITSMNLDEE